jgi:hypothetical protein
MWGLFYLFGWLNVLFFLRTKGRTGGSRPASRLTFAHAATKVGKNALAPSGGHIPLPTS